ARPIVGSLPERCSASEISRRSTAARSLSHICNFSRCSRVRYRMACPRSLHAFRVVRAKTRGLIQVKRDASGSRPVALVAAPHGAYGMRDKDGIDQGADEGTEKKLETEADPGTPPGGELQLLDGEDNGPIEPQHAFLEDRLPARVAERKK